MKNILIILVAVVFSVIAKGQNQDPTIYPHAFLVENHREGSSILITPDMTRIYGRLSMRVDSYLTSLNFIETKFEIVSGSFVLLSVAGPTFQKASDFYNNSYISNLKDINFDIPANITTSILNDYPNSRLVIKYRYRFEGNTNYFPQMGYYTGTDQYSFKRITVQTSISGPSAICQTGNYNVINPGTISLLNANGIATLTSLGSNQYRVDRIGQGTGTVILRSVLNGQVFDKTIGIENSSLNGIINGPVQFNRSQGSIDMNFEYSQSGESGPVLWSVNNPNLEINELSNNVIRLTVKPSFSFPPGQSNVNIMVTAYKQNSCGQASVQTYIGLRNQ